MWIMMRKMRLEDRDTMAQKRVKISELSDIIKEEVDVKNWLMKM